AARCRRLDADTELLKACGVDVGVLDSGCCGLAGNFGFERGHYEVSAACAEHGLWPAVRDARPETAVLADGFSCRTQIQAGHLGRGGMHLAELLAEFARNLRLTGAATGSGTGPAFEVTARGESRRQHR